MDSLTVWFDVLDNHTNSQLLEAELNPPSDIYTYYPDTINKVIVSGTDTTEVTYTDNSGYTSTDYINNPINSENHSNSLPSHNWTQHLWRSPRLHNSFYDIRNSGFASHVDSLQKLQETR